MQRAKVIDIDLLAKCEVLRSIYSNQASTIKKSCIVEVRIENAPDGKTLALMVAYGEKAKLTASGSEGLRSVTARMFVMAFILATVKDIDGSPRFNDKSPATVPFVILVIIC